MAFQVGDRVTIKQGPHQVPASNPNPPVAQPWVREAEAAAGLSGKLGALSRTFGLWNLHLDSKYASPLYGMTDDLYCCPEWLEPEQASGFNQALNQAMAGIPIYAPPLPTFKAGDLVEILPSTEAWASDWNKRAGTRCRVISEVGGVVTAYAVADYDLHFAAPARQFRLVANDDHREFDGYCNPCGGFRKHRLGCPTKKKVQA